MKLFLDRGNSGVKWGAHDDSGWVSEGRLALDERGHVPDVELQRLPQPSAAWLASVARDERDAVLVEQLEAAWKLTLRRITTSASAAGVRCAYAEPSRLGVDRWLGVLAGYQPGITTIVIDAGTAITIDAVGPDGEHRGGLIAPGIGLMRRALYTQTDRIPDEGEVDVELLGRDTRSAVSGGVLQACAGFIDRVAGQLLETSGPQARCLLTGGDAARLQPLLQTGVDIRPRLILEGMLRAADDMATTAEEDN